MNTHRSARPRRLFGSSGSPSRRRETSGFLLYIYRRGLDAPGQYRDPVCGMRTDDSGSSLTHDGETYYFCSGTCKRSFEKHPSEFARHHPQISGTGTSQSNEHH